MLVLALMLLLLLGCGGKDGGVRDVLVKVVVWAGDWWLLPMMGLAAADEASANNW